MTGHPARDEELLAWGKVRHPFGRGRGVAPGPRREFVHNVVPGENEFLGRDLPCAAEGGSVGDGRPAVAESGKGRMDDVHDV